ncbi:unnamed protein product [marine sediment metagenome]|uniref:Uncharacterized protein n=1 Tax=marine sediment metagenome TaxID=412755 RepID=X1CEH6_9ZZZZ
MALIDKKFMEGDVEHVHVYSEEMGKIHDIFMVGAEDFLLFRKGEFRNSKTAAEKHTSNIGKGLHYDFYVITVETKNNSEDIKKLEDMGVRVSKIPKEEAGNIRYFVNKNKFGFFIQIREKEYFGFIGSDPVVIQTLKEMFMQEFNKYSD